MEIKKSSRHSKIIGNFGENLICNFLSRSGLEVTIVDHTGIDIIAYNPLTKQRLGITVKSRTRNLGKEEEEVNIFIAKKDDRKNILEACEAFACEPWIAVYVETSESADVYLTSLKNYDKKYRGRDSKKIDAWKMRKKDKERYLKDPNVKYIRIEFYDVSWEWH